MLKRTFLSSIYIIQIYSGITHGRVLNGVVALVVVSSIYALCLYCKVNFMQYYFSYNDVIRVIDVKQFLFPECSGTLQYGTSQLHNLNS